MAKPYTKQNTDKVPATTFKYDRVVLADLRKGRRGKHHDLVNGIFQDLEKLPEGAAIKIPLGNVEGVSLANLRSAVRRATASRGMEVETLSDEANFYIWRASKS